MKVAVLPDEIADYEEEDDTNANGDDAINDQREQPLHHLCGALDVETVGPKYQKKDEHDNWPNQFFDFGASSPACHSGVL